MRSVLPRARGYVPRVTRVLALDIGTSSVRAVVHDERARPVPDELHRRTGCFLHASYWPAKLVRLRAEQPETFARARRFVSFSDYLYERLLGSPATSLSMASATGLLDQGTRRWDEELLDVLGLTEDRLPPISDEPVEHDGRLWYPALGDGACSNVRSGCTTAHRAVP